MGRGFPSWAPRQIRDRGWHVRDGGFYLPLRPASGVQRITVDDVEQMIDAGLIVRISTGDRDAVAWRGREGQQGGRRGR